jgi:hypothetical protein
MSRGFVFALAVAAGALIAGAAFASSGTVYRQTAGSSPAKAPHIKYVQVSNTKSTVTVGVWLANRKGATKDGDLVTLGLDTDSSNTKIDYHIEYEKIGGSVTAGVWKWNGSDYVKNTPATNSLKLVYYGTKGDYFSVTFPRSRFGVGPSFHFWVETMYGCTKAAKSCQSGEWLPRSSSPGVVTYKLK